MLHLLATLFFLAALGGSGLCLWLAVREDLPLIRRALGLRRPAAAPRHRARPAARRAVA